ncbi:MAG: prephenate dehydratase [Pseudomonadota bacterium]|nr:prephenate dehydratase [Pseudomonadota bacterium]
MSTASDLAILRNQIDELDEQIQALITKRACLAQQVAQAKYAVEEQPRFYRPEREAEVLNKVISRNQGPLKEQTLVLLFREIMSACLALQQPLQIAFLGPAGTYSQAAVLKHFGHAVQMTPLATIEEVFREVEAGAVDYGVVPVENSTEGGVNQTLDCFIASPLTICSEIELPIHHHLLAKTQELANIHCIYAHQQALAQCRLWLNTHLPTAKRMAVNSNAQAAQRAVDEVGAAAIASQAAAEIYQLQILAAKIEDQSNNTTRFAVLGQQQVPPSGHDKTSLLLSSPNRPGSLYQLLQPLAHNHINMTRIESRPSRQGIWEYVYFIDIQGHIQEPAVAEAIEMLAAHTPLLKHLGSYPRAMV